MKNLRQGASFFKKKAGFARISACRRVASGRDTPARVTRDA